MVTYIIYHSDYRHSNVGLRAEHRLPALADSQHSQLCSLEGTNVGTSTGTKIAPFKNTKKKLITAENYDD